MCHDRAFLGEALDVLGLLLEEAQGDEEREVGVDVAGVLEHAVERVLDVLPEGVAPRLDDHAAANRAGLGQLRRANDLLIPLRIILGPRRADCICRLLCHACTFVADDQRENSGRLTTGPPRVNPASLPPRAAGGRMSTPATRVRRESGPAIRTDFPASSRA